jgi:hypothetical protein
MNFHHIAVLMLLMPLCIACGPAGTETSKSNATAIAAEAPDASHRLSHVGAWRIRQGGEYLGPSGGTSNAAVWGVQDTSDSSQQFTEIESIMYVPNDTPPSNGDNFVAYWTALQAYHSTDWIVQAILGYGNHIGCGLTDQWYIQAYAFFGPNYPTGQGSGCESGTAIPVQPGDEIILGVEAQYINIHVCDPSNNCFNFDQYLVEAYDVSSGQYSELQTVVVHERNQAIVAQEWGGVDSCNDTPSASISDINLYTSPTTGPYPDVNPTAVSLTTSSTAPFSLECPYGATFGNDGWEFGHVDFSD